MYAETLLPTPVAICPSVSVYEPKSFTEYPYVPNGPPRHILTKLPESEYADRLSINKQILKSIFENHKIADDRRVFMLALAMQESETMSPGERDWTKDSRPGSENYSMFNINKDFIKFVTRSAPPPILPLVDNGPYINSVSVGFVVDTIDQALDTMSPTEFMLFHSGGITAYKSIAPANIASDKTIKLHADAVKTIMARIEGDEHLRINFNRIGINVPYH